MITKINLYLRKSFVGRTFFRYKRSIKTDKKLSSSKKNSKFKDNKLKNKFSFLKAIITFKLLKPQYRKKFKLALLICFIIAIFTTGVVLYIRYKNLEPVGYTKLEDKVQKEYKFDNNELNTLFIVYESKSIDGLNYDFIQSISLISINLENQTKNTLIINPFFSINIQGEEFSIYSSLNNLKSENKFSEFKEAIEQMLGVRVDRYLVTEKSKFLDFIDDNEFKYNSQVSQIPEMTDKTFSYIFDINLDDADTYLAEQSEFLENLFTQKFSRYNRAKYFLKANDLLKIFNTNMSLKELSTFVRNLNKNGFYEYLKSNLGIVIEQKNQIELNNVLLDEIIRNLFNSIPIRAEQAELEVYNGSNIRGIASKKNREFKNLGVNIVKYGNYTKILDKNTLIIKDQLDFDKYKYTIGMIKRSLYGNLEIQIGGSDTNSTGDIILILGENN